MSQTLLLTLKFVTLFGLPIVTAIVWQKRTQAQVRSVFFAFVLIAFSFVVHLLFDRNVSRLLEHESMFDVVIFFVLIWDVLYAPWIIHSFIFGLIRESSRWLVFRYVPTKMITWNDGVLFGIAYSFFALIIVVGEHFYYVSPDLSQYAFLEKMIHVNWFFSWWSTFYFSWKWAFYLLALNVCTSVAILASVQRGKFFYFPLALMVYILYANAPNIVSQTFSNLNIDSWEMESLLLRFAVEELWRIPLTLLTLILILLLRKAMPILRA